MQKNVLCISHPAKKEWILSHSCTVYPITWARQSRNFRILYKTTHSNGYNVDNQLAKPIMHIRIVGLASIEVAVATACLYALRVYLFHPRKQDSWRFFSRHVFLLLYTNILNKLPGKIEVMYFSIYYWSFINCKSKAK